MAVTCLDDIVKEVLALGTRPRVAIAPCAEAFVLSAAIKAAEMGMADPVLIGDRAKTEAVAASLGFDLGRFEFMHEPDDYAAVNKAVGLFRDGNVGLIMKGLVSTSTILKAVLNKETGVPPKGVLSHVTVYNSPRDGHLTLLTDAGVNIKPTLQRKVDILKNAIQVARVLGIATPKVAMLAATEKVNYKAMPATVDADLITKMSEQGEFGNAMVFGPLALDLAVSPESARLKGVDHPVAGCADILCVPAIESGNVLYKCLNSYCRATLASVVVGSRVPLVVPSRGDSEDSKFYSLALASLLSAHREEA